MELSSLLLFAGALFVAAGSPGPSVAALVARVLAAGWRDVLPFLAAMWLGEAVWLSLACWGLAAVAESFHAAFVALKWLGVAYLLYLARQMWIAPTRPSGEGLPRGGGPLGMFLTGLALTFGNPKIMMFYVALLPSLIDLQAMTLAGWAQLTLTMLAVLALIDLSWMALATRAARLLRTPSAMRVANRCGAGAMAGAAAAIAVK